MADSTPNGPVRLKILVADTYYPAFLQSFASRRPDLAAASYDEHLSALMEQCFGTADFYSRNLARLGHDAVDVIANDRQLQAKWAAEHDVPFDARPAWQAVVRGIPLVRRLARGRDWELTALVDRIRAERPDVVYFQDLDLLDPWLVEAIRPLARLIVGQIASTLPDERFLRGCDLIVTSFPHYVERLRAMDIAAEYLRIGFESTILSRLTRWSTGYGAVFVGGVSHMHVAGNAALERLAAEIDLDCWGYGFASLPADSPLRRRYHGEAWGLQMYDVFRNSRIVVNRHGEVAENCANNMRLFEATGVGAMLITDEKDNLGDLFDVGREAVAYSDADDLVEKVRYYLDHEDERAGIAAAGQARTLRDHTYARRMEELLAILEPYLLESSRA